MKENGVPERLARPSGQALSGCGMWILLASLSVLFFASLVAYLVVRFQQDTWPPPGMPALPPGLWISTALLLLSSGTLHYALSSARHDNQGGVRAGMAATLLLGLAFLGNQVVNWAELHAAGLPLTGAGTEGMRGASIYGVGFYFLTALHAAHVIGGVLPMASVTVAAFRGFYTRTSHNGLRLLSMYWHFLDVVWIVLLLVLLDSSREAG